MNILIIVILVLINSFAQILLKVGATKKSNKNLLMKFNIQTLSGYILLFTSTILSVYLLKFINFKSLTIVLGLNYVSTLVLSNLILKEGYSKQKVLSTLIIVLGVIIFNI
jgi:drug/metabolite transporter (DMT)-like permease